MMDHPRGAHDKNAPVRPSSRADVMRRVLPKHFVLGSGIPIPLGLRLNSKWMTWGYVKTISTPAPRVSGSAPTLNPLRPCGNPSTFSQQPSTVITPLHCVHSGDGHNAGKNTFFQNRRT